MADIGFYHLTRTGADAVLAPLLGRTLAAKERALVRVASALRVTAVDAALWAATAPDWLPHGTARTGHPTLQPIWITDTDENPNSARYLFLLDGLGAPAGEWARIFDLFDGNDAAAISAARLRWTAAKAAGHSLTYWQQGPSGWMKQA